MLGRKTLVGNRNFQIFVLEMYYAGSCKKKKNEENTRHETEGTDCSMSLGGQEELSLRLQHLDTKVAKEADSRDGREVKSTCCSAENLGSAPSTSTGKLTATCSSSSREFNAGFWPL